MEDLFFLLDWRSGRRVVNPQLTVFAAAPLTRNVSHRGIAYHSDTEKSSINLSNTQKRSKKNEVVL